MPTFSILIPSYNSAPLLKRCVDSCLQQMYGDFSIIVRDDSVTNDVQLMMKNYDDARVSYIRNIDRRGAVSNWNKLIDMSDSTYLKLMHHDDYFASPYSLGLIYDCFASNPSLDAVVNSHSIIHHGGAFAPERRLHADQILSLQRDPRQILKANIIGSPSNITVRTGIEVRYDESLKWLVDVDYYLKIFQDFSVGLVCEPIICSTAGHPEQISRSCERDYSLQLRELTTLLSRYQVNRGIGLLQYIYQVASLGAKCDEPLREMHALAASWRTSGEGVSVVFIVITQILAFGLESLRRLLPAKKARQ